MRRSAEALSARIKKLVSVCACRTMRSPRIVKSSLLCQNLCQTAKQIDRRVRIGCVSFRADVRGVTTRCNPDSFSMELRNVEAVLQFGTGVTQTGSIT